MGLFKSKEEKTAIALEMLCKNAAHEANDSLNRALQELKNGRPDPTVRIRKLNELYAAEYGHGIIDDDGNPGLSAYMELASGLSILRRMYLHCLYIGIAVKTIQDTDDKKLSLESLKLIEHYDDILSFIRRYTPASRMTNELLHRAESYMLDIKYVKIMGMTMPGVKTVKELMTTKIELF